MKIEEARSPEKIFYEMHRELRAWNSKIPESPDRLDPILKILLQLYSHQLSLIDRRIGEVWTNAAHALVKAVCPESKHWPVPAHTVMRCKPADPVVEIDPHTRFYYKEKREGGQTFFFSSLRRERLLAAEASYVFFKFGRSVVNLSPSSRNEPGSMARSQFTSAPTGSGQLYIGIQFAGQPTDFAGASIFLKGSLEALRQLRWSHWYPGNRGGEFHQSAEFCPGLTNDFAQLFTTNERIIDWGGLRTGVDLFKSLEENFVIIPSSFAHFWEKGRPPAELVEALGAESSALETSPPLYWVQVILPPRGDKARLLSSFEMNFNCFIAVNKNELTLFKHTGGNKLVEVELPEEIDNILEITGVIDSSGRTYYPRHMIQNQKGQRGYSLEERDKRLIIWFDFASDLELPPDSITVTYAVTSGTAANGIDAGKISELYENHPGLVSAENITSTGGAIPARLEEQVIMEVSARLRNRDRAMTFVEIANWAKTFDPRIRSVTCENGVVRAGRGVRRSIMVRVKINPAEFHSDEETSLLSQRLESFLKSRSPINTHFTVEITRQ